MWLLFLILPIFAQDVLVQEISAPTIDYQQYLIENPSIKSYVQYLQNKTNKDEEELRHQLKMAQYEFIDGSLEKARQHFENIVNMKWDNDWNNEQQKVIHFAHMRLAHLSIDVADRDAWLKKAIYFSPDLAPDVKLFPPPLINRFKNLSSQVTEKLYPLPKGASDFDLVLVNGRPLAKGSSFFRSENQKVRLRLLSNRFQSITLIEKAENLASQDLAKLPIVAGDCINYQFQMTNPPSGTKAFIDKTCPERPLLLNPEIAKDHIINPKVSQKNQWKPKSKWLWWGLAVASAVVTWQVIENQNQQGTPHPQQPPQKSEISNSSASF